MSRLLFDHLAPQAGSDGHGAEQRERGPDVKQRRTDAVDRDAGVDAVLLKLESGDEHLVRFAREVIAPLR